jgi:hypothetical protein
MSVRRRPLLSTHSPKRFWKFSITHCSMLGETTATSSLMFCFKSTVVLGFFSYTLHLRYPQRKKCCDKGPSFWWILKCRWNILWVKTELFLKYVSTAQAQCCTDQRSMATEMLWVTLEECSRTNSPRQWFHSQLMQNRQVFLPDPILSFMKNWSYVLISDFNNYFSDVLLSIINVCSCVICSYRFSYA